MRAKFEPFTQAPKRDSSATRRPIRLMGSTSSHHTVSYTSRLGRRKSIHDLCSLTDIVVAVRALAILFTGPCLHQSFIPMILG